MSRIKMSNVRLSFPNLFNTASFGGEDTGKYDGTFILDKDDNKKAIKEVQVAIKKLIKENLKGKNPGEDRICLKDGDETERDELQGAFSLKASTKKRPMVIDRDKTPITEDDGVIYAGCYVNAIVSLWTQNNAYGKRVNASLEGVQFHAHGEPFGAPGIEADAFDVFGEADDDDEAMNF
jgi:hypothetical protein